jgi:hypothetical protein
MDRVMYARDPKFNQAYRQIADVTLAAPPSPQVTTQGQTIDGIEVLGIGIEPGTALARGAKVDVHVYFHVRQPTPTAYRFLLSAWPATPGAPTAAPDPAHILRTAMRATADGAFATDHWKAGDYVRERFSLLIPADWPGDSVGIGLVTAAMTGDKLRATAAGLDNDPFTAVLGLLPMGSSGERLP